MSIQPTGQPDARGYFGRYGGRYVPETLMGALAELETGFRAAQGDAGFARLFDETLRHYVGRPTPLYLAERLTRYAGGARIFLKREDLNHTGAHKINNAVGQALLTARMGKRRVIAETGAGQHGVATATACAWLGLECRVFMGSQDMARQSLNVQRMRLLGAQVAPVDSGTRTLKDAINDAMREWVTRVADTHYIIGSVVGPHPYPLIVREYQSVIGRETRAQCLERLGRLPDVLVACVGGGSNAMGMFHSFIADAVRLVGVEAAGRGMGGNDHAATLCGGREGVLHGARSYLLQDEQGQVRPTHSVSAGLDYPGVGPEHAALKDSGRAEYAAVTDAEALEAFSLLARLEGILPALESAHAVAHALRVAARLKPDAAVVINLSGRGDKDLGIVAEAGVTP